MVFEKYLNSQLYFLPDHLDGNIWHRSSVLKSERPKVLLGKVLNSGGPGSLYLGEADRTWPVLSWDCEKC